MKNSKLNVSEMRNLGLVVEKDFNAAGVYTAQQVIKLGPEKTLKKCLREGKN